MMIGFIDYFIESLNKATYNNQWIFWIASLLLWIEIILEIKIAKKNKENFPLKSFILKSFSFWGIIIVCIFMYIKQCI